MNNIDEGKGASLLNSIKFLKLLPKVNFPNSHLRIIIVKGLFPPPNAGPVCNRRQLVIP